jgi:hypothetical protein
LTVKQWLLAGTTGGRDPHADRVARELAKTAGAWQWRLMARPATDIRGTRHPPRHRRSPQERKSAPFDAVVEARGNDASPFGFAALPLRHETDIGAPF